MRGSIRSLSILVLFSLAPLAAQAAPTARDLARAVLFDVRERNDPELSRAIQVVVDRGYLAEVPRIWARLQQGPGGPDLARIRSLAETWVRRAYPGLPLVTRRTHRRPNTPEHLWYVVFDIDEQPRKELVVEVDLRTGTVRRLEGVV